MSANRNSLPNPARIQTAAQVPRAVFVPAGPFLPNQTHSKPRFLLRVCLLPISDENHDGGRTFPVQSGESQLRFAVPACIALQRWRTRKRRSELAIYRPGGTPALLPLIRDRFVPALCKKRACPGPVSPDPFSCLAFGISPLDFWAVLHLPHLKTTTQGRRRSCRTF